MLDLLEEINHAMKSEDKLKQLEKIAKALGDKNRLMILQAVAKKKCINCSEFLEITNLAQPSVSHHIKILTEAGLLNTDKEGRFVKLSINSSQIEFLTGFLSKLE
ncbi:MAG: ArsR/SmtB family transcription factor [Cytophagaceae bacterium]